MEALLANPLLLVLLLLLVVVLFGSSRARKQMEAQQNERERQLREDLEPGTWVMTHSGFFGRFVDIDGETVILETPSGGETYWKMQAIATTGVSPFEDDEADELVELTEDTDEEVLGMGSDDNTKNSSN